MVESKTIGQKEKIPITTVDISLLCAILHLHGSLSIARRAFALTQGLREVRPVTRRSLDGDLAAQQGATYQSNTLQSPLVASKMLSVGTIGRRGKINSDAECRVLRDKHQHKQHELDLHPARLKSCHCLLLSMLSIQLQLHTTLLAVTAAKPKMLEGKVR